MRKLSNFTLFGLVTTALMLAAVKPITASANVLPQGAGTAATSFDDMDAGWAFSAGWTAANNAQAYRGGFHVSANLKEWATFTFTGTSFKLIYASDASYGALKVLIDGAASSRLNQATGGSAWQKEWASAQLPSGAHTVKLVHAQGRSVNIDAIVVAGAPAAVQVPTGTNTPVQTEASPTAAPTQPASPTAGATQPASPTPAPTQSASPTTTATQPGGPTATAAPADTAAATDTATAQATVVGNPTVAPEVLPGTSTYYVDAARGLDTNAGTQTAPWMTIQKAANTVSAGATVIVVAGTYAQRVQMTRSGSSGAPIKFQASGTVVMQGFNVKANYVSIIGFEIANSLNDDVDGVGIRVQGTNCDLENNYIHDMPRHGILLFAPPTNYAQTTNCVVRGNRVYRASQAGIEVRGNNHLIEGNEVWGTTQYPAVYASPPASADADGFRFFGTGHMFRMNYIHDIPVETAENRDPHVDCFQTWADSSHLAANNNTFDRNRCSNVQLNARNSGDLGNAFQIKGASGLTIKNNVIYSDVGLLLYSSSGINILNNVFASKVTTNASWYPVGAGLHDSTSVTLTNNIFYNQAASIITVTNTSMMGTRNIEYRSDGGALSTSGGYNHSNDLWGINPLFVNAGASDFRLQYGSAARNTGMTLSTVPVDFDGVARPQGGAYDIGAFEYH